jgi:lipopolysaccharide transport system ATP-binding protein
LLIDEVLAVGDMEFQKKCLGKMGEVSRDGRTVIFVSHSIPMISSLCTHAFLLSHGELVAAGNTRKIVAEYQKGAHGVGATANFASRDNFAGNTLVRVNKGWLTNSSGVKKTHFKMHESIHVHIEYEITSKTTLKIQPNIHLMDANGSHVLVTSEPLRSSGKILFPGKYVSVCIIPGNLLNDGMFSLSLAVNTFDRHLETIFFEQNALAFTVVDTITNNSKRKALGWGGRIPGVIRPALEWSTRKSI